MSQVIGGWLSPLTTMRLGSHFCPWMEGLTVRSPIQLPVVSFILSKLGRTKAGEPRVHLGPWLVL